MPPNSATMRVDPMLTNISIAARNTLYIADMMFPVVPVKERSGLIPQYDQSHFFRDAAERRAPATASAGGGFTGSTGSTYYCHRYSFHFKYADEELDNVQSPFELDRDGTLFVTDKLWLRREVAWASTFFAASQWTGDRTGGTDFVQWNDYGASSPLLDIDVGRLAIEGTIAKDPTVAAMGREVQFQLKWHPDILDSIKHTQRGVVTVELLQDLMEIPKIHVGRALHTTSPMGTAEASVTYSRVWGKHFLMLYVPASASLMTPAAGYTFTWTRVPNAIQYVKRFREEKEEATYVEGNGYWQQAKTSANSGRILLNAVA